MMPAKSTALLRPSSRAARALTPNRANVYSLTRTTLWPTIGFPVATMAGNAKGTSAGMYSLSARVRW